MNNKLIIIISLSLVFITCLMGNLYFPEFMSAFNEALSTIQSIIEVLLILKIIKTEDN